LEHHKAELHEIEPCDAPGDDPARFLRELRQLRAGAGLGHAELAARAHYPCDVIRAAEAGPSLPTLPVLSAYVRGCGGTVAEWEERWRSLTRSPAVPLLPVRPAGESDAATAGARVGSATAAADGHDPEFIMAALSRVADGMAADSPASGSLASASRGSASPASASRRSAMSGFAAAGAAPPAGADLSAEQPDRSAPDADAQDTVMPVSTGAAVGVPSPRQRSGVSSVSAVGQVTGSRSVLPPRTVIAALVAVALCLVATGLLLVLALFG
jgi:Helix-turn-helix domain